MGYIGDSFGKDGDYEYILSQNGVAIVKYYGDATELIINKIEGMEVTSILSKAFAGNTVLEKVILPGSLTYLNNKAFEGCTNLQEINVPSKLKSIGEETFEGCISLSSVIFESDSCLETIAWGAFYGCENLKEIIFPDALKVIGNMAFAFSGLEEVTFTGDLNQIGHEAFWCYNLKKVNNNVIVKELSGDAFVQCNAVYEDYGGMRYVGNWAMRANDDISDLGILEIKEGTIVIAGCLYTSSGMETITKVILPDSLRAIGNGTFRNAYNIEVIEGMDFVEYIGSSAFDGCVSIKELTIPNTLKEIGANAFAKMQLEELSIPFLGHNAEDIDNIAYLFSGVSWGYYAVPDSLKTINLTGNTYETGCISDTKIEKVNIYGYYTKISEGAFENCTNLQEINFYNSFEELGDRACYNCSALSKIELPYGVKIIDSSAFSYCENLCEVSLPDTLSNVGQNAFTNCTSLTELVIPNSVKAMEMGILYGSVNLERLEIPFVGTAVDSCVSLEELFGGDYTYKLAELSITGNMIECPDFSDFKYLETVNLPDSIEIIKGSFYNTQISNLKLPSSLKTIGASAFANSNITNLLLPASVESIGSNAFAGMNLNVVYLPSSIVEVGTEIFGWSMIGELYVDNATIPLGKLFNSTVTISTLSIPYLGTTVDEPCTLSELLPASLTDLETIILQETCKSILQDAFKGVEDATIYCYEDSTSTAWPEQWHNNNIVYYRDKWRGITYFVDNNYIYSAFQGVGDALRMPAKALSKKEDTDEYSYTFLGWDITQDGTVDKLQSTTARNAITANAVYSSVSKEKFAEVEVHKFETNK